MAELNLQHALMYQEFITYFQPIVDLYTGRITGIEARIRWESKLKTQRTATEIFEEARREQLEETLDFIVIDQCGAAQAKLADQDIHGLTLTINVTAQTFLSEDSPDRLLKAVEAAGLKPRAVCIEVPIDAFRPARRQAESHSQALKEHGFCLGADHVKSAAEMKDYLDGIPISTITLDEQLVEKATAEEMSEERIKLICLNAKESGRRIIAEGIKDMRQIDFLKKAGCQFGQGSLISVPRPVGILVRLLKRGRCW
jgi:EAL domain-containing protein (putative c-di-GMP-specific phosphodiesterase class I)